eukprot:5391905-Prorocentrum_lima.AAC.1
MWVVCAQAAPSGHAVQCCSLIANANKFAGAGGTARCNMRAWRCWGGAGQCGGVSGHQLVIREQ